MQAVSEDPAIEVASVRWERVQLIVEARTVSGTPVDTSEPPARPRRRRRTDGADARDSRTATD